MHIGREYMRAINATTSARSRRDGPSATAPAATMLPGVTLSSGATRIAVRPANAPAIVQTVVDVRFTLMPYTRAVSAFEADARTASPNGVFVMNVPSARIAAGATVRTRISRGRTTSEPVGCHWPVNGKRKRAAAFDVGQRDPKEQQQLRHADRRDQQHEARAVEQPPHDRQLDHHADHRARHDRERERQPVRHAVLHVEQREDRRSHRADLPLREVQHAGRAVHEHEPRREHRVDQAEDDAVEHRLLR